MQGRTVGNDAQTLPTALVGAQAGAGRQRAEPKLIALNELKYQSDNKTVAYFCFTLPSLVRFLFPLSLFISESFQEFYGVHLFSLSSFILQFFISFSLLLNQRVLRFKRKSANVVPGDTINFIGLNFYYEFSPVSEGMFFSLLAWRQILKGRLNRPK